MRDYPRVSAATPALTRCTADGVADLTIVLGKTGAHDAPATGAEPPMTVTTRGRPGQAPLGLPAEVQVCLFDLDGVLTQTAKVHAAAWAEMFDAYLHQRADAGGGSYEPFTLDDYNRYVDGKPRADGTRSFLESRGIHLHEGDPDDPPGAETVNGLGNRKNELVLQKIAAGKVEVYDGSVTYLHAVRDAGMRTAVVSSSANCKAVVEAAGIADLLDVRVDGSMIDERHLAGKPAPDTFLAAASELGVEASAAAVFEDAIAGVQAGRAGTFGFVVGVDRVGQRDELLAQGADVAVDDLADLLEQRA